ncbi:hypothetical protein F5Y14DRAFT_465578 [Nemania sp. NC0429]|nr:hypothetical protein F5Y14DRAFT_465578 [Nemania sp. NC0429]
MAHQTFSSTSASSDYIPRTFTPGPPSSYPRELDIPSTSSAARSASKTSASDGKIDRPLMSYSISFSSDWQKDFGNGTGRQTQQRGAWSTRGNAGTYASTL